MRTLVHHAPGEKAWEAGNEDRPPWARAIAVGVDGSAGSAQALRWAFDEAQRRHDALTVVTAWSDHASWTGAAGATGEWLARAVATTAVDDVLGAAGRRVPVWVPHRPGSAASVLRWVSRRVDLLVVGRGSSMTLESCEPLSVSATWQVIAGSACPVVVVGAHSAVRWARIVVGQDGSPGADAALAWGRAEALRTGAELVPVIAPEGSDPLGVLLAAGANADLLVVGVRTAAALPGEPGVLCAGLVRRSSCPVVIVPVPAPVPARTAPVATPMTIPVTTAAPAG